jgi:phosphoglycerate dehydrogenase-like enzyme
MKILIVTGMTLPEVTEEELAEIYTASGEGDIVVVSSPDEAKPHWPDTEVALATIDRATFPTAKNLRWLQSTAAGADMLMYPELQNSDLVLTGEKGLVGPHLADHAFALLLSLTRQLKRAFAAAPDSYHLRPILRKQMYELEGKTLGIVGLGGTGRAVAQRAVAFGMDVIAVDSDEVPVPPTVKSLWGMDRFHELLSKSDVVVVCCPLTPETRGLFDDAAFDAMKPDSFIINVTRGPIIDDGAVLRAIEQGKIAGAGLDVHPGPVEPLPVDHGLWKHDNVVITPHTAGASQHRAHRNVRRFIDNLPRYRNGTPLEGVVDKQRGF